MNPLAENDKIILSDYQGSPIAIILVVLFAIVTGICAGTWIFFHVLKMIMS